VMMELKDKMLKTTGDPLNVKAGINKNQSVEEATAALITLGFVKSQAEKVISQIIRDEGRDMPTETLVRMALRLLSA
jgi:Holliday junction DNA helicase RuvA